MQEPSIRKRKFQLSKRLSTCAGMLSPNTKRLIDVGSDHGLFSIFALREKKCEEVLALEIEEGPLARTKEAFEKYSFNAQATALLNNGLQGITLRENDSIIIAGMGGLEICDILSNCAFTEYLDKAYDPQRIQLIVQAMKSHALLRLFLALNGFIAVSESLVEEQGHVYLSAAYTFPKQAIQASFKEQLLTETNVEQLTQLRVKSGLSIAAALLGPVLAKRFANTSYSEMTTAEEKYVRKQVHFLHTLQGTDAIINGLGKVSDLVKQEFFVNPS